MCVYHMLSVYHFLMCIVTGMTKDRETTNHQHISEGEPSL